MTFYAVCSECGKAVPVSVEFRELDSLPANLVDARIRALTAQHSKRCARLGRSDT